MSKAIAYLLFTSAFCVAPVLANMQDVESTTPSTEQSAQASAISDSEESFADSAYNTEELDQDLVVSYSEEDFQNTTFDTGELEQSEDYYSAPFVDESAQTADAESEEDYADTAFYNEELEQAESAQGIAAAPPFIGESAQTAVAESEKNFANTASDAAPSIDESAQTAVAETEEDFAYAASASEESEQAESTLDVAIASPSNNESTPAVSENAQDLADAASTIPESAQAASETTDMAKVNQMIANLESMKGKEVIDPKGELMGTIIGVDEETSVAVVELANGRTIAVMPEMLTDMGNGIVTAGMNEGSDSAAAD